METDDDLFTRCGGVRKMAEIIGEPPSTVQSWKVAGRIPSQKQPTVLERVGAAGIAITAEDVIWPLGKEVAHDGVDIEGATAGQSGKSDEFTAQNAGAAA